MTHGATVEGRTTVFCVLLQGKSEPRSLHNIRTRTADKQTRARDKIRHARYGPVGTLRATVLAISKTPRGIREDSPIFDTGESCRRINDKGPSQDSTGFDGVEYTSNLTGRFGQKMSSDSTGFGGVEAISAGRRILNIRRVFVEYHRIKKFDEILRHRISSNRSECHRIPSNQKNLGAPCYSVSMHDGIQTPRTNTCVKWPKPAAEEARRVPPILPNTVGRGNRRWTGPTLGYVPRKLLPGRGPLLTTT